MCPLQCNNYQACFINGEAKPQVIYKRSRVKVGTENGVCPHPLVFAQRTNGAPPPQDNPLMMSKY